MNMALFVIFMADGVKADSVDVSGMLWIVSGWSGATLLANKNYP